MTKPFDPTKPCTFNGRPARIICTDRKNTNGSSILFLYGYTNGAEGLLYATADGTVPGFPKIPLVNVPDRSSRFINLYKNAGNVCPHSSLELARRVATRVGANWTGVTVEVIYEDDVPVETKLHYDSQ